MNILSFLIYCVVATFTPGPTNIVILSSVQHSGAKNQWGMYTDLRWLLAYYSSFLLC